MRENFSEKNEERHLPLEYRNPFQAEVFRLLIASKILDKKDMDQVMRYSRIISDFLLKILRVIIFY